MQVGNNNNNKENNTHMVFTFESGVFVGRHI